MSGIQNELGSKGFQAVEAAINENPDVPGFIQRFSPKFPVGVSDNLTALGYMQFSMVARPPFVPWMLIIDKTGMIREQYTGNDPFLSDESAMDKNIRAEVQKLLSEGAKSPTKTAGRLTTKK